MKTTTSVNTSTKTSISQWIIISGLSVLGLGGGAYWYFTRDKKKEENKTSSEILTIPSTDISIPKRKKKITPTQKRRPGGLRSKYVMPYIKYGSRHPDVKIVQRFLKFKKADIGKTGRNRDGIDGIYGPKTLKAAKKYLKKTKFSRVDVNGMKAALQKFGLK